jgi:hypothetical protein
MAGSGEFPKLVGDTIFANDYNTIRNIVVSVVSDFWGNSVSSSSVAQGEQITALKMNQLRADIAKSFKHITNTDINLFDKPIGEPITRISWNGFKLAADYINNNKTVAHPEQLQTFSNNVSITSTWNGQKIYTVRYTWADATQAQYFFNTGGRFVADFSGDGSSGTGKDNDWQNNILNNFPEPTYDVSNWNSGTTLTVTKFGGFAGTYYLSNYARVTMVKQNSTTLDVTLEINDADAPSAPRIDENINTNAYGSITRFVSFDQITAPNPTATVLTNSWS